MEAEVGVEGGGLSLLVNDVSNQPVCVNYYELLISETIEYLLGPCT